MFLISSFLILHTIMSNLQAAPINASEAAKGKDIDVLGKLAVDATLPTSGNVAFKGTLHASGSVKISGSSCLGCPKLSLDAKPARSLTPATFSSNHFPLFGKGFKATPVVRPPRVSPMFAPNPWAMLSRLRKPVPRKKPLFIALDFPCIKPRINNKNNYKRQILNVNTKPLPVLSPKSEAGVADNDTSLRPAPTDSIDLVPIHKDHFKDTNSLVHVSGVITINRRF